MSRLSPTEIVRHRTAPAERPRYRLTDYYCAVYLTSRSHHYRAPTRWRGVTNSATATAIELVDSGGREAVGAVRGAPGAGATTHLRRNTKRLEVRSARVSATPAGVVAVVAVKSLLSLTRLRFLMARIGVPVTTAMAAVASVAKVHEHHPADQQNPNPVRPDEIQHDGLLFFALCRSGAFFAPVPTCFTQACPKYMETKEAFV